MSSIVLFNAAASAAASAAADDARAFAETPEDQEADPVDFPGEYSARHYAAKAAAAAARHTDVTDFGAVSGAADHSANFQAALDAAPARDVQPDRSPGLVKAKVRTVVVPDGEWTLTQNVGCSDDVVWVVGAAAAINGAEFLDGTLVRAGRLVGATHTGYLDGAVTALLKAGRENNDDTGGVYGITSYEDISRVGPPHSVTLQIDNDTQIAPVTMTGTTFTTTDMTWTDAVDVSRVKVGGTVTVFPAVGNTLTGVITSVDADAKTITTSGFWRFTGATGVSSEAPANGSTARIDYFDKLWGQNTNVFLRSGHPTKKAVGYEMGLLNYQSDAPALDFTSSTKPIMWGYDAVNLGPFKASAAFTARAGFSSFRTGYASYGSEVGFQIQKHASFPKVDGLLDDSGEGNVVRARYGGQNSLLLRADGTVELGRQDAASTWFMDLHSSGAGSDYDARLQCAGGSASAGGGIVSLGAAGLRPLLDLMWSLGSPTLRLLSVFAKNFSPGDGTVIWTSGSGTPEGAVTAVVGSLYTRTDGAAGTTLYVKETGTGNTGWSAK